MGAQNFSLSPKFPENGGSSAPNLASLANNFCDRVQFFDGTKFGRWGQSLPPPCNVATGPDYKRARVPLLLLIHQTFCHPKYFFQDWVWYYHRIK